MGLQNCYLGFSKFLKMKKYDNLKKWFWKYFWKFWVFFRRNHVQDILKVSPCSNFQLDISDNGWVIRFFVFRYAGYIILHTFNCMFWHDLKVAQENKWCHWISELKLHLINTLLLLLVTFKIRPFFTRPWPDLQFSLLKMPLDSKTDTIIELWYRSCHN